MLVPGDEGDAMIVKESEGIPFPLAARGEKKHFVPLLMIEFSLAHGVVANFRAVKTALGDRPCFFSALCRKPRARTRSPRGPNPFQNQIPSSAQNPRNPDWERRWDLCPRDAGKTRKRERRRGPYRPAWALPQAARRAVPARAKHAPWRCAGSFHRRSKPAAIAATKTPVERRRAFR